MFSLSIFNALLVIGLLFLIALKVLPGKRSVIARLSIFLGAGLSIVNLISIVSLLGFSTGSGEEILETILVPIVGIVIAVSLSIVFINWTKSPRASGRTAILCSLLNLIPLCIVGKVFILPILAALFLAIAGFSLVSGSEFRLRDKVVCIFMACILTALIGVDIKGQIQAKQASIAQDNAIENSTAGERLGDVLLQTSPDYGGLIMVYGVQGNFENAHHEVNRFFEASGYEESIGPGRPHRYSAQEALDLYQKNNNNYETQYEKDNIVAHVGIAKRSYLHERMKHSGNYDFSVTVEYETR